MENVTTKSSWRKHLLDTSESCFLCYKHTKLNNSFSSLKHLCLLLNVNTTEIFKENNKVNKSDKLDVTVSTCDPCAKIIAKLSALYESLEVTKMEIDYYLKCFKLVGKGVQEDVKLMDGFRQRQFSCEPEYLIHVPIYHRLRSNILEKCSENFVPKPEVKLDRLSSAVDAEPKVEAKIEVIWKKEISSEEEFVGDNDYIFPNDPLATEMNFEDTSVLDKTTKRPHHCGVCGKTFKKSDAVKVHMRIHTGSKPYKCKICDLNFTFRQQSHAIKHITERHNIHKGQMAHILYNEEEANREMPNPELKTESNHSEQVDSPEPEAYQEDKVPNLSCKLCGKTFSRKNYLNEHIRTHTGERPYECTICGLKFFRFGVFWEHKKMHQFPDGKPFECSVCRKRFSRKIYLTQHFRSHTGEKPYACDTCGKTFHRRDCIRKHVKRYHE